MSSIDMSLRSIKAQYVFGFFRVYQSYINVSHQKNNAILMGNIYNMITSDIFLWD